MQVTGLLALDMNNAEYQKLAEELRQAITLTEEAIKVQAAAAPPGLQSVHYPSEYLIRTIYLTNPPSRDLGNLCRPPRRLHPSWAALCSWG
jgi:hypothetical protein